jgi:hypothetical protein
MWDKGRAYGEKKALNFGIVSDAYDTCAAFGVLWASCLFVYSFAIVESPSTPTWNQRPFAYFVSIYVTYIHTYLRWCLSRIIQRKSIQSMGLGKWGFPA